MNRPFAFTVLCTIALATALSPSRAEANQSCEGLAKLSLKNVTITSAVSVAASATLPAHCRVFGIATPTIDSAITFEVLLPAAWNGKYLQAGNGGYGGSLGTPMGNMLAALQRGYAAAGTDMGHSASDPVWAFGHPERVADWGYRANHVTAQTAKAIVKAFYGEGPELSYFSGCSDGGHEALMEAQRFPEEFDGIIAGAPANFWTHQSTAWIWEGAAALSDPASALSSDKLKLVTSAAVAACDGIDGLNDGLIDDPRNCRFDPASLLCGGGDPTKCLTAPQVAAVKKIYAGPRNPRTGAQIYPGLERGSEYAAIANDTLSVLVGSWSPLVSGPVPFLGDLFFKQMVFNNLSWDFRTLDYDGNVAFADTKMAPIINSTNPDLSTFRELGGKLIMYHGWNDPLVNPRNSINYYENVIAALHREDDEGEGAGNAAKDTQKFLRLFMAPGMTHCLLGPGPNVFDTLTALENWVEQGRAPERLIASGGAVAGRTRPLCPFPKVARHIGHGSINDAANFACVKPEHGSHDD
ncbi:MAG: tannase/feruloyl esterase family alpha/beta hydrolase [Deltaproteobacteria bacterium]|nr:MAG: tannase/feruloyl esterase family alpha/beta hydrolase [Deltaproteobacteria bacterium]